MTNIYACEVCGHIFPSQQRIDRHKDALSHWNCEHCHRRFRTATQLHKHYAICDFLPKLDAPSPQPASGHYPVAKRSGLEARTSHPFPWSQKARRLATGLTLQYRPWWML